MRRDHARGFSLVELLVVTAVTCLSVAMLLPAVQSAKSAARRASCVNNLKQIGLATLNYSAAFGSLPLAMTLGEGHGNGQGAFTGILAFAEQIALFNAYNFHVENWYVANHTVVGTSVNMYLCPDNPNIDKVAAGDVRYPEPKAVFAKGHYGANWGGGHEALEPGHRHLPQTSSQRGCSRAVGRRLRERAWNVPRCDHGRHHAGWSGQGEGRQTAGPQRCTGGHHRWPLVHAGFRREA